MANATHLGLRAPPICRRRQQSRQTDKALCTTYSNLLKIEKPVCSCMCTYICHMSIIYIHAHIVACFSLTCIHTCTCICVHVSAYTTRHTQCIYIDILLCVYICTHMCVSYICIHVYMYVYTYSVYVYRYVSCGRINTGSHFQQRLHAWALKSERHSCKTPPSEDSVDRRRGNASEALASITKVFGVLLQSPLGNIESTKGYAELYWASIFTYMMEVYMKTLVL